MLEAIWFAIARVVSLGMKGRALQDNAGFSGGGPGGVGSAWKPGVKTGASADKRLTVGGGGGGVGVGQCGC